MLRIGVTEEKLPNGRTAERLITVAEKPVTIMDEILAEKRSDCALSSALRQMDHDLQKQVKEALASPRASNAAIARVLDKRGYHLNRHRISECRKNCTCGELPNG